MGHAFCKSHWRLELEEQYKPWRTEACFAHVKPHILEAKKIQTEIVPSYNYFGSTLTAEKATIFANDVLEVLPGVATRISKWEFEYLLGSYENYLRFLGIASLLRAVEEWWFYIDSYFEMRENDIPKDVALLCMGLYEGKYAQPGCGHMIVPSLRALKSLKNFSLKEALLDSCKGADEKTTLWNCILSSQWFHQDSIHANSFPSFFKMTPQVYKAFVDEEPIGVIQTLLRQPTIPQYNALAA